MTVVRRWFGRMVCVVSVYGLAACSPPIDPDAGADAGPCLVGDAGVQLQMGYGNPNNPSDYRVLAEGATVALTPGPQGGQHVWIQLHGRELCPEHPQIRLTVVRASDDLVIGVNQFQGNRWEELPGQPGTFTTSPMAASIEDNRYCPLLNGGRVRVRARVDDRMGHVTESTVNVTINGWSPDSSQAERDQREGCCADFTNTTCWPMGPPPDAGLVSDSGTAPDAAVAIDAAMDTGPE